MGDLFIKNPAAIVSPRPGLIRGKGFGDLLIREGVSILIRGGIIEAIGDLSHLEQVAARDGLPVLDAKQIMRNTVDDIIRNRRDRR